MRKNKKVFAHFFSFFVVFAIKSSKKAIGVCKKNAKNMSFGYKNKCKIVKNILNNCVIGRKNKQISQKYQIFLDMSIFALYNVYNNRLGILPCAICRYGVRSIVCRSQSILFNAA